MLKLHDRINGEAELDSRARIENDKAWEHPTRNIAMEKN